MEWVPFAVYIAVVLLSLINAVTTHYSLHTGVRKALLFISEMLSICTSAGVVDALMKPPFTSRRP